MDFLMNLIQLGLDAGILALCCEVVFRQKAEIKAKDFFVFPILLVLCVVPRVDFSIGANMTPSFNNFTFDNANFSFVGIGITFCFFSLIVFNLYCFPVPPGRFLLGNTRTVHHQRNDRINNIPDNPRNQCTFFFLRS